MVCLQAKLNYFNRDQNLLTRWFTAEYSTWFDLLLPGLYSLDVAIPLGGTSNHFVTERLPRDRRLGRVQRHRGRRPRHPDLQRADEDRGDRLDHLRGGQQPALQLDPAAQPLDQGLPADLPGAHAPAGAAVPPAGPRAFAVFQLFVGGNVLTLLINPIYWALTILWFATRAHVIQLAFPGPLMYAGMLGLLLGNFVFTFAAMAGCIRRRNYEDVKYAVLTPIYWVLMSVAAWKGFLQLFYKPFYWEKTIHGHYLFREDVAQTMHSGGAGRLPRTSPVPEHGTGASTIPALGGGAVPQPKWTPPDG